MTNIWVVNDEYVSIAGLLGPHIGLVSKGFDISNFNSEYLTIDQVRTKAEEYFKAVKKYPDTSHTKKVIEALPNDMASLIDQISDSLKTKTYNEKYEKNFIDWLENRYENFEYYENSFEIETAINKTAAKSIYLNEQCLREHFELDNDAQITNDLYIEYTNEQFRVENEEDRHCTICIFNSITFRTEQSNIVLGFTLNTFSNPGDLPILTWDKFYLNDGDIWLHVHNDPEWITNFDQLSNEEILALWK
ncbi:hypothetical protein [Candidatus Methylopumilus planktonicus]|uniref:hypothetical protein n=1 Tax=Candidatus Methylopumilus planktonicus TaxID=1581557 RepID=UPI003BEF37FF